MGLLAGLVLSGTVFAQSGSIYPETSGSSSILAEYEQAQVSLIQQRAALISQGATAQRLQAWRQQNAPQIASLQQLAQQLGQASALQPSPVLQLVIIPADASSTEADFLTTQANLANANAQLRNQLIQSLPANATQDQIQSMIRQAEHTFQQQHAGDFALQVQRAQTMAAVSASQPIPLPGPAPIPPDATPQLQAYLTAMRSLLRDRARLWNQYLSADPATRRAAMKQWQQQNAARFDQITQLAQSLSNQTSTQETQDQ